MVTGYMSLDWDVAKFKLPDELNWYLPMLDVAVEMTNEKFRREVMNEGSDYLILLYDSSSSDSYTSTSIKQVEKVASRFKDLNIKSVKIGAFDMRAEAPPVELKLYGKLP